MKRLLTILLFLFAISAWAQQSATISGLIKSEEALPEGMRVGVHVVNLDGVTLAELASAAPVAGTFSVTTAEPAADVLQPFRSGAVPLPGLQNEYRISPEGVNYARALTKVYVDNNGNEGFDGLETDTGYLGVATVEDPLGFFVLLYVDKDATLSGSGTDLNLTAGWNIFTVRFPEDADPLYNIQAVVEDAVLDVFNP